MELLCRACLKTNRIMSNIFDYSHNTKSISDSLMELTSIKIIKGDGLPNNICNNCLKKLDSACDFKQMIIESNRKLLQSQQIQIIENEKQLQYKASEKMLLSDEDESVKSEDVESSSFLSNVDQNKTEAVEIIDCQEKLIKRESLTEELDILGNCKTPILMEDENDGIAQSDPWPSDDSTDNITCLEEPLGRENEISTTKRNAKQSNVRKKKNGKKYDSFNEEQLKLLDNPDCKRIMESELSRNEKSRSKVFCRECNRTLTFRYYVEKHVHTHTGNLPFKCDQCNLGFPKEYHLKRHLRIHSLKKEFTCEECGKAFTTIQHLKVHKVIHSSERPYKCNLCEKTFKLQITLRNHKLYHNTKAFVCESCGKAYFHKRDLIDHQATHSQDKKIPCKTCGKLVANKKSLYGHMKKHLDVKPYACSTCDRRFSQKSLLDRHILIHTGAKPYACKVCGKQFRQLSCIPRHMRIHTGETPYPCKFCSATFKYSHHLQNHMKKHNKEVVTREKDEDTVL